LGIPSKNKYQNDGGPGFKDCFDLLKKTTRPAIDRNMLAKALVFNYLIGNTDAHGKNFSLLHHDSSQISLTPFYDLLSTQIYSNLSSKMAMKIGSRYEAHEVLPRHWEQECELIGYSYPALKQLIHTLGEAIIKSLEMNREFYVEMTKNVEFVDKLSKFIKNNIELTLKKLAV
jgi:serine/threonine-protein kinase HipA